MSRFSKFAGDCRLVREDTPIIHNITNYVAMNFSANALLAIGASPIMSSEPEEMEDISAISSALVVNIGCIEKAQAAAVPDVRARMTVAFLEAALMEYAFWDYGYCGDSKSYGYMQNLENWL